MKHQSGIAVVVAASAASIQNMYIESCSSAYLQMHKHINDVLIFCAYRGKARKILRTLFIELHSSLQNKKTSSNEKKKSKHNITQFDVGTKREQCNQTFHCSSSNIFRCCFFLFGNVKQN